MTQTYDLLEKIVEECHNADSPYPVWLARFFQDFEQYPIVNEYIRWNDEGQIVKDGYDNSDMKLYWYVKKRAKTLEEMKTLFYVEGLILLQSSLLTADYFSVACLRILIIMTDIAIIQSLSIDDIANIIRAKYEYITDNKEEILSGYKTWRPDPKHKSSNSKKVFRKSKEQFIKLLDECKEMTDHRSYSYCLKYFIEKTGLSKKTFQRYLKEYDIEFDEREKSFNTGRKASTWPRHINEDEWRLSIKEIADIIWKRCNWLRKEGSTKYNRELDISISNIKKYKAQKMKELGVKKTKNQKEETPKKKIIPDFNMEFSNHQIED